MSKESKRNIFTFIDGEEIYFSEGAFDEWCVYRQKDNSRRHAQKDSDYFAELLRLATKYEPFQLYKYFIAVYEDTNEEISQSVITLIRKQANELQEDDRIYYGKVMMTIYYAMVAEENRKSDYKYPLKKRVKKIGVHQVLVVGMTPQEAANYSRGKKAPELKKLLLTYEASDKENGIVN